MARNTHVRNKLVMKRSFVVKTKALAVMADRVDTGRHVDIAARTLRHTWRLPFGIVDRIGRILREGVQNVSYQQFLMLLLVMQPDFDDFEHPFGVCRRYLRNQALDRGVDMRTVGSDVLAVWPGYQAALRPRVPRACGDIIRVEEKRKSFIEDPVRRIVRHQQKLLEKPGDMGAMPLGWTCIRHRLNDLILNRQVRRASLRLRAHAAKRFNPDCTSVIQGTLGLGRRPFM